MIEPTVRDLDTAPGDPHAETDPAEGLLSYGVGLGLAVLLTVVAFVLAETLPDDIRLAGDFVPAKGS